MTPRKLVTDKTVLEKRARAFYEGTTTSHWPHEYAAMCPSSFEPEFDLTDYQKVCMLMEHS